MMGSIAQSGQKVVKILFRLIGTLLFPLQIAAWQLPRLDVHQLAGDSLAGHTSALLAGLPSRVQRKANGRQLYSNTLDFVKK
jgi:hypothetical protein